MIKIQYGSIKEPISGRKKNKIDRIKDENGCWVEGTEAIGSVASNYFKRLFQSSNPQSQAIEHILESLSAKITVNQRDELDKPFKKKEIKIAIKSMNPTKVPGPDGMLCSFKNTGT